MKIKALLSKVGKGIVTGYKWYEENTNSLERKITRSDKTFDDVLSEKVYEPIKTHTPTILITTKNTIKNTAIKTTDAIKNIRNPEKKEVDLNLNKIISGEEL